MIKNNMINILIFSNGMGGCQKYRQIDPHINLMKNYPHIFNVDFIDQIPLDKEYIQRYQIVQIHHHIDTEIIDFLKKQDIKIVADFDDYFEINTMKDSELKKQAIYTLQNADLVTCTTEILASFLQKYNKNVCILPNAIDPNDKQFIHKPIESKMVRFGYAAGSTHLEDVKLLSTLGNRLSELKNTQIILAGYDTKGIITEINRDTDERKTRYITPEESIYLQYEMILTNNHKNIKNEKYLNFLNEIKDGDDTQFINEPIRRIWTKPISIYAECYNQFDVTLAPLVANSFNGFKSQLKAIESGFHHLPIIASNTSPYNINLTNAFNKGCEWNNRGNALLIDPGKDHKGWFKYVKMLSESKALREDLGEKLYETVKEEFDLNNVNKKRKEIYINLVK